MKMTENIAQLDYLAPSLKISSLPTTAHALLYVMMTYAELTTRVAELLDQHYNK